MALLHRLISAFVLAEFGRTEMKEMTTRSKFINLFVALAALSLVVFSASINLNSALADPPGNDQFILLNSEIPLYIYIVNDAGESIPVGKTPLPGDEKIAIPRGAFWIVQPLSGAMNNDGLAKL